MKKAFTLIEMVIVLVVIGILMGATMYFGSDRIVDLKAQSLKDSFVDEYHMVHSHNLASSYQGTYRYSTGTIRLDPDQWVVVAYDGIVTGQLLSDLTNMKVQISWPNTLSFVPYHMGCEMMGGTWTGISFTLLITPHKKYCFDIRLDTCTLRESVCISP